jgi:hypothetical protein
MATMEDIDVTRAQEIIDAHNSRTAVVGEVVTPPSNGLALVIKGEEFECRRVGTTWQMMQFSKAQQAASITVPRDPGHDENCECPLDKRRKELETKRNEAGMKMLSALYDTAMVLLKPAERDRFREFMDEQSMSEDGIDAGELEEAIGNVIAAAGGEKGKAGSRTSRHSSASSTNTNTSVARVSPDKGTDGISVADVS